MGQSEARGFGDLKRGLEAIGSDVGVINGNATGESEEPGIVTLFSTVT